MPHYGRYTSVARAIANWLASPATAGAELDLAKAYDTVGFSVGTTALHAHGCSPAIAALMGLSWGAVRYLSVSGTSPVATLPLRGLPQGCPMSGYTLAVILGPWKHHCTQAAPTTATWAFVDDRSLKVTDPHDLHLALAATTTFDTSIGLVNNTAKQQTWPDPQAIVEHLGVKCNPADPSVPVLPRDGWDKPIAVARQLGRVPDCPYLAEY